MPIQSLRASCNALKRMGMNVEYHEFPDSGHKIVPEERLMIKRFLLQQLPPTTTKPRAMVNSTYSRPRSAVTSEHAVPHELYWKSQIALQDKAKSTAQESTSGWRVVGPCQDKSQSLNVLDTAEGQNETNDHATGEQRVKISVPRLLAGKLGIKLTSDMCVASFCHAGAQGFGWELRDRIVEVNGMPTTCQSAFAREWDKAKNQLPVFFTVCRKGEVVEVPTINQEEQPMDVPDLQVVDVVTQVSDPSVDIQQKQVPKYSTQVVEKVVEVTHVLREEVVVEAPQSQIADFLRQDAIAQAEEGVEQISRVSMQYGEKVIERKERIQQPTPSVATTAMPITTATLPATTAYTNSMVGTTGVVGTTLPTYTGGYRVGVVGGHAGGEVGGYTGGAIGTIGSTGGAVGGYTETAIGSVGAIGTVGNAVGAFRR